MDGCTLDECLYRELHTSKGELAPASILKASLPICFYQKSPKSHPNMAHILLLNASTVARRGAAWPMDGWGLVGTGRACPTSLPSSSEYAHQRLRYFNSKGITCKSDLECYRPQGAGRQRRFKACREWVNIERLNCDFMDWTASQNRTRAYAYLRARQSKATPVDPCGSHSEVRVGFTPASAIAIGYLDSPDESVAAQRVAAGLYLARYIGRMRDGTRAGKSRAAPTGGPLPLMRLMAYPECFKYKSFVERVQAGGDGIFDARTGERESRIWLAPPQVELLSKIAADPEMSCDRIGAQSDLGDDGERAPSDARCAFRMKRVVYGPTHHSRAPHK